VQWQELLRLARRLVLAVGTFLRRIAMACSVAPTGPNGSSLVGQPLLAASHKTSRLSPAVSPQVASSPAGGAATEFGNRVGILEKMKDLIGFL
jgi:hypothetical protein